MGFSKSSCRREVYSNIILPQEARKASTDNLYLHPKQAGERRRRTAATTKQPNISRRKKKNHKDQSRNKWKRKGKIERLIKLKAGSLRRQTKLTNV